MFRRGQGRRDRVRESAAECHWLSLSSFFFLFPKNANKRPCALGALCGGGARRPKNSAVEGRKGSQTYTTRLGMCAGRLHPGRIDPRRKSKKEKKSTRVAGVRWNQEEGARDASAPRNPFYSFG